MRGGSFVSEGATLPGGDFVVDDFVHVVGGFSRGGGRGFTGFH